MSAGIDRRALFFVGASIVCWLLVPLTDSVHRWVPISLGVVYVLLAAASWADRRGRAAGHTQITDRPASPGEQPPTPGQPTAPS